MSKFLPEQWTLKLGLEYLAYQNCAYLSSSNSAELFSEMRQKIISTSSK